jgi:hypothetical protein
MGRAQIDLLHHEIAGDVTTKQENFPLQKFFIFRKIGC